MRYLENGKIIVDNAIELRDIVEKKEIPLELIDIKTSELTNLDSVFYNIEEINGDISNWDISSIISINSIFSYSTLNVDISRWDTSNVEDMHSAFYESKIDSLDISCWNTSKVKIMSFIFRGSTFNGDISSWDVSNVENMEYAFKHSKFNGNLSKWDVSNCEIFEDMFSYSNFDGDISSWDFKKIKKSYCIFDNNKIFKYKYNNGNEIPNHTKDFLKWFEANRDKMKEINTPKEKILDFFNFDNNINKELN